MNEKLKKKIDQFKKDRDQAVEEWNKLNILIYKYNGAIEGLQIILNELDKESTEDGILDDSKK